MNILAIIWFYLEVIQYKRIIYFRIRKCKNEQFNQINFDESILMGKYADSTGHEKTKTKKTYQEKRKNRKYRRQKFVLHGSFLDVTSAMNSNCILFTTECPLKEKGLDVKKISIKYHCEPFFLTGALKLFF